MTKDRRINIFFRIGVILKGVDGFAEIFGGILSLLLSPSAVQQLANALTRDELTEDPNDIVSNLLLHGAQQLSIGKQHFIAVYLLIHGATKVALVIGLLKNIRWVYPVALVVFSLFVIYQGYLFSFNHSPILAALTILDAVIVWLVWREYRTVRAT